ncbi:hypothetical protein U1Q18_047760 [Sarracenia purpurea var. burkii]
MTTNCCGPLWPFISCKLLLWYFNAEPIMSPIATATTTIATATTTTFATTTSSVATASTARGTPANRRVVDRAANRYNEYAGRIILPRNIGFDYSNVSCYTRGGGKYRTNGDAGSRNRRNFRNFQDATQQMMLQFNLLQQNAARASNPDTATTATATKEPEKMEIADRCPNYEEKSSRIAITSSIRRPPGIPPLTGDAATRSALLRPFLTPSTSEGGTAEDGVPKYEVPRCSEGVISPSYSPRPDPRLRAGSMSPASPPVSSPSRSYAQVAASTRNPRANRERDRESESYDSSDFSGHRRGRESRSRKRARSSGSDSARGCEAVESAIKPRERWRQKLLRIQPDQGGALSFRRAEGRVGGFTRASYGSDLGYFAARWLIMGSGPLAGATAMQMRRSSTHSWREHKIHLRRPAFYHSEYHRRRSTNGSDAAQTSCYPLARSSWAIPGEDGVWRYPLANVRLVGRQFIVSRFFLSSLIRRYGYGNASLLRFYEIDAITFYEFDAITLLRDRRCYVSSAIDATIFRQCDVICFIEFTIRDSRIRTSVVGVLFARRDRGDLGLAPRGDRSGGFVNLGRSWVPLWFRTVALEAKADRVTNCSCASGVSL